MNCASTLKTLSACLLALILIFSATPVNLQAQVTGGTISGTVVDSSGRVIPNARIAIMNTATGIGRTVNTNTDGFYTAPNLLPGNYDLTFTAPGFKTDVRRGITLTVGAAVSLDLTMQIGTTIETVQVQAEAPAVQLTTSDIGAVVNATTVRELPLNGRSWTDLAELQPGVNAIQTQPDFAAGKWFGGSALASVFLDTSFWIFSRIRQPVLHEAALPARLTDGPHVIVK